MVLTEKETTAIKDLQTQEQTCIEKYKRYGNEAKDPVLKDLFQRLEKEEQKHYDSLGQALKGTVPSCDCNDQDGKEYNPTATYSALGNPEDKKADCFLATDCIGTEKMVSSEYNSNVFKFGDSSLRKLLADIQIEEQNHAEMLYKYKTVNGMA
ncbi:MAG: ferritin-like domain-containing protein [Clostridiales bacterium]|nr:ferritin-like domain-containing protein [Clostridiales bacterium]